jgi:hypothetical protein
LKLPQGLIERAAADVKEEHPSGSKAHVSSARANVRAKARTLHPKPAPKAKRP